MLDFFTWLAATPWSVALKESLYVWPLLESIHVLTLTLFVGTAVMLDVRLLGWSFRSIDIREFTGRLLPWTRVGFAVMVTTGALLFYATPVRYYQSIFFRLKVVVLLVAGFNVWWFHVRTHRRIADWGSDPVAPRVARVAAIVSIAAWAVVIVAGRLVAYNWFDCDLGPHSEVVNWLAGCEGTP